MANIFLHYVLDLWVQQWRRRKASGRATIVRYADDFVMGFEKVADARQMVADLKERLVPRDNQDESAASIKVRMPRGL